MPVILLFTAIAVAAPPLTFAEAVARAVDSPAARAAQAQIRAEIADAQAAGAWAGNPVLDMEIRPDERSYLLGVPLDPAIAARRQHAARLEEAAGFRGRVAAAAVAAAVGGAWLDAKRAGEHAALLSGLGERAVEIAGLAARQVAAGEWSPGEAAWAQAESAGMLDRAARAGVEARAAARRLWAMLGEDVAGEGYDLGGWPGIRRIDPDPASLPAILSADLDARAAAAAAKVAGWERLPGVSAEAGYAIHGTGGWVYGVSLELPIFATRAAPHRAAQAQSEAASALRSVAAQEAQALLAGALEEAAAAEQAATAWAGVDLRLAREESESRLRSGELAVADYLARVDRINGYAADAIDARWRLERARLALWEMAGEIPEVVP